MIASILLQAAAAAAPAATGALGGLAAASPWIAAGGAALQLGLGIAQMIKANKLKRTKQPTKTTPQAQLDLLARRKFAAGVRGLPGQGQIERQMAQQQAGAVRGIQQSGQSSAAQLGAIAAIDQQTKQAQANLGVQGAQFNAQNQQLLDQAQQELAAQQRAEQEYNVLGPFRDKQLAQAALYQGGMTNISQFAANMSKIFAGDDDNKG